MGSGIAFIICGLCISVLINFVYFSKQRIDSYETKLYGYLIVTNLCGLILEFCCTIICSFDSLSVILRDIFVKTYLCFLVGWAILFVYYILIISYNNYKNVREKIQKITTPIYVLIVILLFLLPINHINNENYIYASGPAVIATYVLTGICVFIMFIIMMVNTKKLKDKKYLPLFTFIILGSIVSFLQMIYPQLLMVTAMESYVMLMMYFTIENPDVKMIEQLNIAKEQAEKANNAKSDFLSSMSHEIRTPLNAIVGFSQALSEEDLPPQAKDEVKDIIMASETLLDIVNGILDISKIEANKLEIIDTEYNLNTILNDVVLLSKTKLGDKPLELRCSFDPSIPTCLYGDKIRVKQIILNLLTNAIKYTKEGWVEFKVNCIQKEGVCRLIISVEDTGVGIKQENIDKLFTKFQRVDEVRNSTIEGTGLGLAITKRLLELMGGQIVVQSVHGKGSKFTVALDQRIVEKQNMKVEKIEEAEKVELEDLDLSSKRILIVDDNKINLKVATRLLGDYNCFIETADSGFECIEKIKAGNNYDLILMDDMMPKITGTETFHHLKEESEFNIPIVALTANAISGMKEKYLKEGFDDYLSKPIEKEELYRVLVKFLQQK